MTMVIVRAAVLLSLASFAAGQSPPFAVREVPLPAFSKPLPLLVMPRLSALAVPHIEAWLMLPESDDSRQEPDLHGLVSSVFTAEREEGHFSVDQAGASIVCSGAPGIVDRAVRFLDGVIAHLARPIAVTVVVADVPPGEMPPAIVDAATWDRLFPPSLAAWRGTSTTRSGGHVGLGDESWQRHVAGLNCHIAGQRVLCDPQVELLFSGARILAGVHALPGGSAFAIHGLFEIAEPLGSTKVSPIPGELPIDLPVARGAFGLFGARVAAGGGAVLTLRCADGLGVSKMVGVRVEWQSPAPAAVDPVTLMCPVSALTAPSLLRPCVLGTSALVPTGWDRIDHTPIPDYGQVSPVVLARLLCGDPSDYRLRSGHALVAGSPEEVARIERLAGQLATERVRSGELTFTVGEAAAPRFAGRMPVLLGREAALFVGIERAVLADHDSETEGGVTARDPVVAAERSGVSMRLRARPSGGVLQVDGSWLVAAAAAPEPSTEAGRALPLQIGKGSASRWQVVDVIDDAESRVLGDTPFVVDGAAAKLAYRLRAR